MPPGAAKAGMLGLLLENPRQRPLWGGFGWRVRQAASPGKGEGMTLAAAGHPAD
jgi:hypothetical protein